MIWAVTHETNGNRECNKTFAGGWWILKQKDRGFIRTVFQKHTDVNNRSVCSLQSLINQFVFEIYATQDIAVLCCIHPPPPNSIKTYTEYEI